VLEQFPLRLSAQADRYVPFPSGMKIPYGHWLWQHHQVLGDTSMSTAKEELAQLIHAQPADSSREEIVRELAFHVMVERGIADSDAKRVCSNGEMAHRIRSWRK
jgi:hypothetical protein